MTHDDTAGPHTNDNTTHQHVEITTRYATTTDDLPTAWTFLMEHLDQLGENPTIRIKPFWINDNPDDDTQEWRRIFEVTVEGTVEQDT